MVPPGVCGSWPLLAVWDSGFPGYRQPTMHNGPSWSVRLVAAPRSVGLTVTLPYAKAFGTIQVESLEWDTQPCRAAYHCKHASWQSRRWPLPCTPSWQRTANIFPNAQLMSQLHGVRRSVSLERMQNNSRTSSIELQILLPRKHEKDTKLSKSPPHSCACCARVLAALLHSAVCVRRGTSAF